MRVFDFGDARLLERFWDKVIPEPNSGCWLWTGSISVNGYGRIGGRIDGVRKDRPAHRLSYQSLIGPIGDGLVLDHLCRVRCCVNPAHLEAVTQQENVIRGDGPRLARERWSAQTHCKQGHEFTPQNTHRNKRGRSCRACDRARRPPGQPR